MALDLTALNEQQKKAVTCVDGPLLVLAGAGSGKTRVLTYRIAHIIEKDFANPWEVLAITFTNKAAAEMRKRLGELIGSRSQGMWVSTFHSMCVRMLRADAERLGFSKNFTIYDQADSKRLVRDIVAQLDINPKMYPINVLCSRISQAKNELCMPEEFADGTHDPVGKQAARVYTTLQERLKALNAFDFDDLLVYAYLLLKHHSDVLSAYQERFKYLLVDEYQDTNHAQYEICRLIAQAHHNIMVVGDDDQSIYSWRGADLRNILEFESDYPECTTIKLEQNYRSTSNILNAANAVIAHNVNRKNKRLFTDGDEGEKIQIFSASDERDEGRWIAGEIEKKHQEGMSYAQMALFYRTNAQSRMLEDMMLRAGVPYRIVGGTRFFERKEIQDVMSYLSLVVNPSDDIAALRVINEPKRGIGKSTIEDIQAFAHSRSLSFVSAVEHVIKDEKVRPGARKGLEDFVRIIRDAKTYEGDLRQVIERVIDDTGIIAAYQAEGSDEALSRIENIKELLGVVDEFVQTHDDEEADYEPPHTPEPAQATQDDEPVRVLRGDSLLDFIEWVRLRTDLDAANDGELAVTLMTIHASKGLEFDCVWVAGMEESLFPHSNSIGDAEGVEEERRLAYVALTRARKALSLSYAHKRHLFGSTRANPVSRFVVEIPAELRVNTGLGSAGFSGLGWEKRGSRKGISGSGVEAGRGSASGISSASGSGEKSRNKRSGLSMPDPQKGKVSYEKGDKVDHRVFGRGVVTKVDGDILHVKFEESGDTKRLMINFAPLVKISPK